MGIVNSYLSLDDDPDFGAALYDFDDDGIYEYRLGDRYDGIAKDPSPVFHTTLSVTSSPREIEAFLNDSGSSDCLASVHPSEGTVYVEAPSACVVEGINVLVVRMRGERRWIRMRIRFHLEEDEDYTHPLPLAEDDETALTCPSAPCWSLSDECLNGTLLEDGTCGRTPILDGTPCDDGDPATITDRCLMGTCMGSGTTGDVDADGIDDDVDRILGDSRAVDTSMLLPAVTVGLAGGAPFDDDLLLLRAGCARPVEEVGSAVGPRSITFYGGHVPMLRFDVDLDQEILDLAAVHVDANRGGDGIGFVAVDFDVPPPADDDDKTQQSILELPSSPIAGDLPPQADLRNRRLALFVDRKMDTLEVCVREGSFLDDPIRITSDCSGEGEVRITCRDRMMVDGGEEPNCDTYRRDWLRVRMNGPGVAWQVSDDGRPFTMDIHARTAVQTPSSELPHRLRGILVCTSDGGPDCSERYCAPGYDLPCLASHNLCRYGTGACGRPAWPEIPRSLDDDLRFVDAPTAPPVPLELPVPVPGGGFITGFFPRPDDPEHHLTYHCLPAECWAGDTESCWTHVTGTTHHCSGGTRTCTRGGCWGPCNPPDTFGPEICDDIDNDCDGEMNEEQNRWPEFADGSGWSYTICNDNCGCTDDACLEDPAAPSGWSCSFTEDPDLCDDRIACTLDECHPEVYPVDEHECTNTPRDYMCEMGDDPCFCDGFVFCNRDATTHPSEEVSGCEQFSPCGRESFCQVKACCDDDDACYHDGNADACIWGLERCYLHDDEACRRAHEAGSTCCSPDCNSLTSTCEVNQRDVYHPNTGLHLGSVHCAEDLFFPPDCEDHSGPGENACNEYRCDVPAGECVIDHGSSCNDGLECTTGDRCRFARDLTWWPLAGGVWTDEYFECVGDAQPCDVDFCFHDETHPIEGWTAMCMTDCADLTGEGITHLGCIPDQAPGLPIGCSLEQDVQCEYLYWEDLGSNCLFDFRCDPIEEYCEVDVVVCDDEIDCTQDTCNPYDGLCDSVPIDSRCDEYIHDCVIEWCDPASGCTIALDDEMCRVSMGNPEACCDVFTGCTLDCPG